jgi:cytochrome c553
LGWLRQPVSLGVILVTLVGLGMVAGLYVVAGGVDVSADKPDNWLTANALHFVFKRSMSSRSHDLTPPDDLTALSRVQLAAQHYDTVCANCHGRPGYGQSVVPLSMNPRPQYLPKVLGQFNNKELYQIVEHGVKYSAMPSWPTDARGDEVWSMVAFLRRLQTMDANTYREMTALPQTTAAATARSSDDANLRPANASRNSAPKDEFLYAAPSAGFSDQTVSQNPAATCARCHGVDGSGAATGGEAPNLTIQTADYLQAALNAYTNGARKSGYMQNFAAQLSGAQVAALAHYYAGLPVKTSGTAAADPALIKRGETIATQGIPDYAIPACETCHESTGAGITHAPHIAGQSATYLRRQLGAMGRGGRGSTEWWNPMPAVAHNLGANDIAALATYYSNLKPVKGSGGQPDQPQQAAPPQGGMGGDPRAVKALFAKRCLTCHVNNGRGDLEGGYPNLTLHDTTYAAQSLYEFRRGVWPNVQMRQAIDGLSLQDLARLAAYIDTLPPQPSMAKPDAQAAQRGAAIAMHGVPANGVPACLSCHDAKGVAALPLIPPLQGQNPSYLRNRLENFAKRYDVNLNRLNPMPSIARRLTDQQRADLAAYFAATPPLAKAGARR